MADPEKPSRTLREAGRGQREYLAAIVALLVSIFAAVANAGYWVQLAGALAALVILFATWPRWGRIKTYKRQDRRTGRSA